jgi:hypothetical protein
MSVIVTQKATSKRLTTPTRASAMLGFGDPASLQFKMALDAASTRVATYCHRVFGIETVQERFEFLAWDRNEPVEHLLFTRYPVVDITKVVIDGVIQDPTLYEHDDLFLYRLVEGERRCWSGRIVFVEYRAGYTLPSDTPDAVWTLPDDIERATVLLAGSSLSMGGRDPMVKSEQVEGIGQRDFYVQGASASLPHPEAESLLQEHRCMVFV